MLSAIKAAYKGLRPDTLLHAGSTGKLLRGYKLAHQAGGRRRGCVFFGNFLKLRFLLFNILFERMIKKRLYLVFFIMKSKPFTN